MLFGGRRWIRVEGEQGHQKRFDFSSFFCRSYFNYSNGMFSFPDRTKPGYLRLNRKKKVDGRERQICSLWELAECVWVGSVLNIGLSNLCFALTPNPYLSPIAALELSYTTYVIDTAGTTLKRLGVMPL